MTVNFPEVPDPSILIIEACGELDLYSVSEFAKRVLPKIVPPLETILLDFEGISYLDSSGTGAVICILQKARSLKARLLISGLRRSPRKVLEMVNLLTIIPSFETPEEAFSSRRGR